MQLSATEIPGIGTRDISYSGYMKTTYSRGRETNVGEEVVTAPAPAGNRMWLSVFKDKDQKQAVEDRTNMWESLKEEVDVTARNRYYYKLICFHRRIHALKS